MADVNIFDDFSGLMDDNEESNERVEQQEQLPKTQDNEIVVEENFLDDLNSDHESFKAEEFQIVEKKKSYRGIVSVFLIAIVLMVGYKLFIEKTEELIDFSYMTYADATSWGSEHGIIVTQKTEYSSEFEEGAIMTQSIASGTEINKEFNVLVTVSSGLDPYEVIELPAFDSSWSKTNITSWISENGIENYQISYMESETVDSGFMIDYQLNGATPDNFTRSSDIYFVVSYDGSISTITVSGFLGKTIATLDEWAQVNDISYTYTEEYSEVYDAGKIMYQSVTEDTAMYVTDTLEVIVSLGEMPVLTMKDFTTDSLVNADAWVNANGLKYTVEYEYSDLYSDGKIMSQSVDVDTELYTGQSIHFVVSKGSVLTVPDLSDVSKSNVSSYADNTLSITVNEIYKSSTSAGDFISQSQTSGTVYTDSTRLTVTYSLGSTVSLSNYEGKALSDLQSFVSDVNSDGGSLSITVSESYSSSVETGEIISQSLKNEVVSIDSSIDVVVSKGELYTASDFSGLTVSEAYDLAETDGVTIVVNNESSLVGGELCTTQSVAVGTMISGDTVINLDFE